LAIAPKVGGVPCTVRTKGCDTVLTPSLTVKVTLAVPAWLLAGTIVAVTVAPLTMYLFVLKTILETRLLLEI